MTTTKTTSTEEESPTTDKVLKAQLQILEVDGQIGFIAEFNQVKSEHLIHSIVYMLDTAFNGDREMIETVTDKIPEMMNEYFKIKDEQEEEDMDLASKSTEALTDMIMKELKSEDFNVALVDALTRELQRRVDDGERDEEKPTDITK